MTSSIWKRYPMVAGLAAVLMVAGLAACEDNGAVEETGEAIEGAGEETGEAVEGAAEETGEAMEETGEEAEDAAQ